MFSLSFFLSVQNWSFHFFFIGSFINLSILFPFFNLLILFKDSLKNYVRTLHKYSSSSFSNCFFLLHLIDFLYRVCTCNFKLANPVQDCWAFFSFPLWRVWGRTRFDLDAAVAAVEAGVRREVRVALSATVAPHAVSRS